MFRNYYELVITEILIIFNIAGSGSYQDSILDSVYLDESYLNQVPPLSRYRRQTPFNTCVIPNYPLYTTYTILGQFGSNSKSGEYAPNFAVLRTTCDKGYKLNPFAQNLSVCIEGLWRPEPTNCMRSCPSLESTISAKVNCSYNDIPLDNCYDPVEETTVVVSCNPLYEDSTKDKNLGHLCLDGKWEPYIPQCNPICGQKRAVGTVNIISGTNTQRGSYPWHVGIYSASNKEYLCGGTIISRNVVLSAAYCFTTYNGNAFSPESYIVAAGKYHRKYNHRNDEYAQYSKIRKINIPPRYKGVTTLQAFDIAVLVLEHPFLISIAVQPVCIELNEQLQQLYLSSDSIGIVTGWGYTQEGRELADVLKEVNIPHIPFDKCYDEIPKNFKPYFTQDKICGGYKNNATGICTGDSGGGLVFNNKITNRFYIKGIVSTTPATAMRECDSNQYSLYTSIAFHIHFIRDVITQNHLHYSVECKYDKCATEKPEDINEDEEIILITEQDTILATNLAKELLISIGNNGSVDNLCESEDPCSCLYVLFISTTEPTRNFTIAVRKIVKNAVPDIDTDRFIDKEEKTCSPGATCYNFHSVLLKVPAHNKGVYNVTKETVKEDSANNLVAVEIFEDYDKCTFTTLLKQVTRKVSEIIKSQQIARNAFRKYNIEKPGQHFKKVLIS